MVPTPNSPQRRVDAERRSLGCERHSPDFQNAGQSKAHTGSSSPNSSIRFVMLHKIKKSAVLERTF